MKHAIASHESIGTVETKDKEQTLRGDSQAVRFIQTDKEILPAVQLLDTGASRQFYGSGEYHADGPMPRMYMPRVIPSLSPGENEFNIG